MNSWMMFFGYVAGCFLSYPIIKKMFNPKTRGERRNAICATTAWPSMVLLMIIFIIGYPLIWFNDWVERSRFGKWLDDPSPLEKRS